MAQYDELIDILKHLLLNRFSPKPNYTRGVLGDGLGNVEVPGRPDKSYVRFNRGSNEYFEIFNRTVNPVNDWPVLIGELPWQPGLIQVVNTDWSVFEQSGWGDILGSTSPHAPTHEWPDGSPGSDPLDVHLRSIVPLRAYLDGGTGSTTIFVNSLEYEYQGSGHVWGGLPGVDLLPAINATVTGTMRYMGIYLDPIANSLGTITGTTTVYSDALTPPLVSFPAGVIPAARVRVYGSQSKLNEIDIRDGRRLFTPFTISGVAGGDLTGSYPDPRVTGLFGSPLVDTSPNEGEILMFSGSAWRPTTFPTVTGGVWPLEGDLTNTNDGVSFATVALLIAALAAGEQGIIGNGTFTSDDVDITENIRLLGSGIDATVLQTSTDDKVLDFNTADCILEGFTLKNTNNPANAYALYSLSSSLTMTRLKMVCTGAATNNIGAYLAIGTHKLTDCVFDVSGATNDIALYVDDDTTVDLFNASVEAGDVSVNYSASATTVTFHGGVINGNLAVDGSGATVNLDGCNLTGNLTITNSAVVNLINTPRITGTITGTPDGWYTDGNGVLKSAGTNDIGSSALANKTGDIFLSTTSDAYAYNDTWGLSERLYHFASVQPTEHWLSSADDAVWTGYATYTGFATPNTINYSASVVRISDSSLIRAFKYRPYINAQATMYLRAIPARRCQIGLMVDDGVNNADGLGANNFYRIYIDATNTLGSLMQFQTERRVGGGAVTTTTFYATGLPPNYYLVGLTYGIGTRWTNWSVQGAQLLPALNNTLETIASQTWTPARIGIYYRNLTAGANVERAAVDWYYEA